MNKNESLSERGQLTIVRLEQALQRLLDGNPKRTQNDGRLSLSRVNKEAGLSSGGIYYYNDFVEKVRKKIHEIKLDNSMSDLSVGKVSADKMRTQRDKERDLKVRYRDQRNNIKDFCNQVISNNAKLEFALFEALDKIDKLEEIISKTKAHKVFNIKNDT